MKIHQYVLMLCAMVIFSCKKDKNSPQLITPANKGIVKGKIIPSNSPSQIILTGINENGSTSLLATRDDQGNFQFSDLASGTYTLVITRTKGYETPSDTKIQISGNNIVVLPAITVTELGKGSFTGKISPADAVTAVSLVNDWGQHPVNFDPKTGDFSAENLFEGNYRLNVTSDWKYTPPAEVSVTVKAKTTSVLGTIICTSNGKTQMLSCAVDTRSIMMYTSTQSPLTYAVRASYENSKLSISGSSFSGSSQSIGGTRNTNLDIRLKDVTGPGTYQCDGSADSEVRYSETTKTSLSTKTVSGKTGKNATIVIATIDPVARRISGTFSGTLDYGEKISNGFFDVKY